MRLSPVRADHNQNSRFCVQRRVRTRPSHSPTRAPPLCFRHTPRIGVRGNSKTRTGSVCALRNGRPLSNVRVSAAGRCEQALPQLQHEQSLCKQQKQQSKLSGSTRAPSSPP
eukprot:Amastigsp_a677336_7.p4 type:complete len:112 gc:universal Amastigsp_a677336_7:384-49(-)